MIGSATDIKHIELAKRLSRLRDHIEIQRIIGLNAERLRQSRVSDSLLGYMQLTALESLAMEFAKIFERTKKFDLNSISGTTNSIEGFEADPAQMQQILEFGAKYGNSVEPQAAVKHLRKTYRRFCRDHRRSLAMVRHYRNKFGAHSEAGAEQRDLPSEAEFEALFEFANDFYCLVARTIVGAGPAQIESKASVGFVRLMDQAGAEHLRLDFNDDE